MDICKIFWAARGIMYKFSFGQFGKLSYIGKPISIRGRKNIVIGDFVRIYPGARMEAIGEGRIEISENTSIAQNVHIIADKENLKIGKNTTISGNVFITNVDHDYQEVGRHIMKQKRLFKTTKIGENCFIGFGAVIQAGTILGKQCIVGSNSVVRGIFPDCTVIAGVPAKIVKQYNVKTKEWESLKDVKERNNDKRSHSNV